MAKIDKIYLKDLLPKDMMFEKWEQINDNEFFSFVDNIKVNLKIDHNNIGAHKITFDDDGEEFFEENIKTFVKNTISDEINENFKIIQKQLESKLVVKSYYN